MEPEFWDTLILTFKLALYTVFILFIICLPLIYWLTHTRWKISSFVESFLSLPLVLPPTVIGFYLLVLFNPFNFPGSFLQKHLNFQIAFSFTGIVLGSLIYNLPFMIQPILSGLRNLPISLKEAAYTCGKSKVETYIKVLLPNIKPALTTGALLTFAHTLGEFGVVLMIGGSIPKETRVASIAIYNEVQALNYSLARQYSLTLLAISLAILILINYINKHAVSKSG